MGAVSVSTTGNYLRQPVMMVSVCDGFLVLNIYRIVRRIFVKTGFCFCSSSSSFSFSSSSVFETQILIFNSNINIDIRAISHQTVRFYIITFLYIFVAASRSRSQTH